MSHPHPSRRSAFTLIEILVVIVIIGALAVLTASASIKMIEVQQVNNTQSVLNRTQGFVTKMHSAVKDQAYRETIQPDTAAWIQANLAGNDANAVGRTRVIYVKLKLRQAFPMNFTEALYPPVGLDSQPCTCAQLQPLPGYVAYLHSLNIYMSGGFSYESSACLLMALQRGVAGQGVTPEQLTAGGAGGIDNTYNAPVLTDAWQRPIYFSRVPVGSPILNPNGATLNKSVDPEDPQGYLMATSWGTSQYAQLFQSITQQQLAPANSSYMIALEIGSGGPARAPQPSFNPVTFAPVSAGNGAMYSTP